MRQEDFEAALAELTARDPHLCDLVATYGVPQVWARPPGFPALVLLVLEQQVSLASGAATYRKVRARIGVMRPERLLATTSEELREDGVSRQKDRYLRALSEAVATGALDLDELEHLDDDGVRARLVALPGIGRWTADTYLLASLARPDVWPVGDRALQVAVAEALALDAVPDQRELEDIGERWRPHRASAARMLWHGYLERRGRVETPVDLLLEGPDSPL